MRTNLIYFTALLSVVLISFSCSNNEENTNNPKVESSIEHKFNMSKASTIGHNDMLANMYEALLKKTIRVKGHIINNEKELNNCINLFIEANSETYGIATTRSKDEVLADFTYLKSMVLQNFAFQNISSQTRTAEEIHTPDYLMSFYNEFFKSDELEINNLNDDILSAVNMVMSVYPDLTEEEINGLLFVAGVTYNSCVYWNENADKWISLIGNNTSHTTRCWLCDGVKNGVKKWAKADASGAIEVWATSKFVGAATGGTALLAGAAVGSTVGAFENLPIWD